MADAQRTIDLIFNGVDKTGAATLSALNNAEKFSTSLKTITQPISDFTVGALKLEAGLLTAGVAMTTFAVKAAGDFDSSFREISTLLDQPVADLGEFREAILKYAATSTAPLEQVTQAIYNAISAGVPLADSIAAVAEAEKLSVAGKGNLNDTLRVLVGSLNAYGLEMDSAGRFSDALFTAVKLGQTTLPELANSLSQVTGAAAAVGVPFETVLAAVAALTAAGTPTAQAMTQINAVLTSFLKPSSEAAALAQELGIEFGAQAVKAKGLEGVLADVTRATGGNQEQMARLFGSVEAVKAVFPLTGAAAGKFAEALKEMADKAGATDDAFAKMADAMGLSSQKIANAFNVMLVTIGTPLLDEFGGVAKAIAAIFAALGASVTEGGLKKIVEFVEKQFKELQATLETVAKNLPAALEKANFSGFTDGIKAVTDAFKTLFGGINLTSVEGLTRAIELAGAAFLGLSKFSAGVVESFKPLFDKLVQIGAKVGDVDSAFFKTAGNIGGAVVQFNALLGIFGGLAPVLGTVVGLIVANQGVSLVAGLASMSKTLPAVVTGFRALALTPAGLASMAAISALVPLLLEWKKAEDQLTAAKERGEAIQERAIDTLQRFNETTGKTVKTIDEAMKMVDDGTVVWSDSAGAYVTAAEGIRLANEETQKFLNPFGDMIQKAVEAADAADGAAAATTALASSTADLTPMVRGIVPIIDAATGKIVGYEEGMVKATDAGAKLGQALEQASPKLRTSGDVMGVLSGKTNLTNDQLIELAKNTKAAEIELEKLASNERVKFMEFSAQINVAQIEADTQRIEASFESINTTINSTAALLGDLFQILGNGNLGWDALRAVERQIDLENKARQDAFALQKKLTEAQIEEIKARTQAMQQGEGIIKIDGAGLQPHLEAFMWEILKTIQVRVNQDGLAMLLGVN